MRGAKRPSAMSDAVREFASLGASFCLSMIFLCVLVGVYGMALQLVQDGEFLSGAILVMACGLVVFILAYFLSFAV